MNKLVGIGFAFVVVGCGGRSSPVGTGKSTPDAGAGESPFVAPATSGSVAAAPTVGMTPEVEKLPASVGTATMAADGTIALRLVTGSNGMHGEALRTYAKSDKDYGAVLKHLGGLVPGQSKPIPPWE